MSHGRHFKEDVSKLYIDDQQVDCSASINYLRRKAPVYTCDVALCCWPRGGITTSVAPIVDS